MSPEAPVPSPPPPFQRAKSRWATSRGLLTAFAAVGVVAVLAAGTMLLNAIGVIDFDLKTLFSDSDEAPIRVRNGSLGFTIVGGQEWEPIGASGNWRIANADRHREEFEVTVAVTGDATCGGKLTATGSDIVLVYERDNDPATANSVRIVLQSAGRRTVVKPDVGVVLTMDSNSPEQLTYQAGSGFLQSIAVGNGGNPATMCSFTSGAQLDHIIILNVP